MDIDVEAELQAGIKLLKQERYALKVKNSEQTKRIAELQAELEKYRWIPIDEIPKNDSYHIVTDGSKCEWLYFNEVWVYAENKKPYPRFFMIKFYWPISLPEQAPAGSQ